MEIELKGKTNQLLMRISLLLSVLFMICFQCFSQTVETDIFNNLNLKSADGSYTSTFAKNIFGDYVFSDNRGNQIKLERKYIDMEFGRELDNPDNRMALFMSMSQNYKFDKNYTATYSVDIFDKIVIQDNRKRKVEIGKDFFGNESILDENNGQKSEIKKGMDGSLKFAGSHQNATLEQNIFKKWVYKDSNGNLLEFSNKTWTHLKNKFGTDGDIFHFLIYEFLIL